MALNDKKNSSLEQTAGSEPQKPCLLFVDYAVPQYDLFAGSRTNFMYLQMLVEMGFEVLFLAEDFHPLEPYTTELNDLGIETLVGEWYRENWQQWLVDNGERLDYVFLHKPDPAAFFLPAIKRNSKATIIYQCHDLHYLRLQRKAEIEQDVSILEEAGKYQKKENFIFANSDVLLTFSEVEEKVIQDKFPDKKVFTVPLFFYRDAATPRCDFEQRKDIVFVGACAHSPNHDALGWFCSEILPFIQKEIPDIVLKVVGAEPPADIASLQSSGIDILGRISDEELSALYAGIRMMVVPLRFGAGVKGKVIESMHNGIPLVSTSIGLEGIKDIDKLAQARDTPAEFAAEVISIYTDTAKLTDISRSGAGFVEDNFSLSKTMRLMNEILKIGSKQSAIRHLNESYVQDFEGASVSEDIRVAELQGRVSEQAHQLEVLQEQVAEREAQVNDMLSSTSWKLSFPIRWLKQHLLDFKKPHS